MHIVVVGTKAQLIKMAPVMLEMERQKLKFLFVLTGQHNETMDDLINDFGLRQPDDIWVELGEADTKLKLLKWLAVAWKATNTREYLKSAKSILVHGDTVSTLLGALVGRRYRIPVMHVEAGLRSFNFFHPFPEELIRILVSKLSNYYFCPGDWANDNLLKSGIKADEIINTEANTLLDSLRVALGNATQVSTAERYGVVSLHRHENLTNTKRFNSMMEFIIECSRTIRLKFILHPVTRLTLQKTGWMDRLEENEIQLMDRMGYVEFINLLQHSQFLISDGGSNQEESYYMGLPCILLRKTSERIEGIGENITVVDYDYEKGINLVKETIEDDWKLNDLLKNKPSELIVQKLKEEC